MFPYANELTPFETDRSRELLQTARILNIRDEIRSTSYCSSKDTQVKPFENLILKDPGSI